MYIRYFTIKERICEKVLLLLLVIVVKCKGHKTEKMRWAGVFCIRVEVCNACVCVCGSVV